MATSDASHLRRLLKAGSMYYRLTRPGIIYGNLLTVIAGYLFADSLLINTVAQPSADWWRLVAAAVGSALVIAAGCVLNNIMDRDVDRRMERTRKRALAEGSLPISHAAWFAAALGVTGLLLLAHYTHILTVYIGLAGLYLYVVAYGAAKRRGPGGTLVGSLAGSAPILAGYTAASGRIDWAAVLIFVAMACWQMPHFYAIALYRLKEYKAAGIPVLPAVKGVEHTKRQILAYIAGYGVLTIACSLLGYTGISFAVIMSILTARWLYKSYATYHTHDANTWGRAVFKTSLHVLLVFSLLLAGNRWLP